MNLVIINWHILSYFFLSSWFLFISIVLSVINAFWTIYFAYCIGQINPWTSSAVLTFHCSGVSESSLLLFSSISDALFGSQLSSLSFGLSQSPFQLSQFLVSEMLSSELSSSLLAGWWSICLIWRTFNTWVRPSGRYFADKAGGTGDFSDNLNSAAPSCSKFHQNALMISSVSEMYPPAVICLFWA